MQLATVPHHEPVEVDPSVVLLDLDWENDSLNSGRLKRGPKTALRRLRRKTVLNPMMRPIKVLRRLEQLVAAVATLVPGHDRPLNGVASVDPRRSPLVE